MTDQPTAQRPSTPSTRMMGAVAALTTGLAHAWPAPEHLREMPLLGALFVVAAVACGVVTVRLWQRDDLSAWLAGSVVCAGMAIAYLMSRTVGLFGMRESWDSIGAACLLMDVAFLAAAAGRAPHRQSARAATLLSVSLLTAGLLSPVPALAWGGGGYPSGCFNSGCTTEFAVPLPIPAVLAPTSTDATTDYYNLTEQQADISVIPGKTTPMWTYNGTFPAPLIKATSGRAVKLHVTNVNRPSVPAAAPTTPTRTTRAPGSSGSTTMPRT